MNLVFDPTLFWMVGSRLSGFIIALPGISESTIPKIFRAAIVGWLTIIMVPSVPKTFIPSTSLFGDFIGIVAELLLGIGLGLVIRLIFATVEMSGLLIDSELGLMAGNQLNPLFPQSIGHFAQIFNLLGSYYFWTLGYFPLLILALHQSFVLLPPASYTVGSNLGGLMLQLVTGLFFGGLTMAAPIIALTFVQTVAVGFFIRSVQGINIFFESFTLRIVIGFGGVILFLPILLITMRNEFEYILPFATRYFQSFTPLPVK